MAQQTTGNTETQMNRPHPTFLHPAEWMDETYDESLDMFYFDIISYNGIEYRIALRAIDIERMNYFKQKESQSVKYFKHISKYY